MTMLIDFSSRPPAPDFNAAAPHLQNYRRIYAASETRSARPATADLDAYLSLYEEIGARHVVLKARDVETTFGFKIANETVADFCKAQGPRYLGFAGVDPHKGAAAVAEFDHAIRTLGLCGLNISVSN
jgi:predicted TIM-barrel fold metal-dependent hydrolase